MSLRGAERITQRSKKSVASFSQVTVTGAATLLVSRNDARYDLAIINLSGVIVFIGNSGVTIANGVGIPPSGGISLDTFTGPVYAIISSGSVNIGVLEV